MPHNNNQPHLTSLLGQFSHQTQGPERGLAFGIPLSPSNYPGLVFRILNANLNAVLRLPVSAETDGGNLAFPPIGA